MSDGLSPLRILASVAILLGGLQAAHAADKMRVIKDCAECPELVVLPVGSFVMGEAGTQPNGKKMGFGSPAITVKFEKPFAMGKTEVTIAQWRAFVKETGYKVGGGCKSYWKLPEGKPEATWEQPQWEDGRAPVDNDPVVCVTFPDIQAYVAWLNKKAPNRKYALPNEAQYEYATRAGTTGPYPWAGGPDEACKHVNVGDIRYTDLSKTSRELHCDDGFASMAPVASYPPNAFGLSDLIGNTWEWVNDCGGPESLADYPRDGVRKDTATDCPRTRGGGSMSVAYWMHSTARGADHKPETRLNVMGFRVVANAP